MSLYASNRGMGGGSGSGVNVYTNLAAFPASAPNGTLAVAGDTHIVYEYNTTAVAWQPIASNTAYVDAIGSATSIGALDAQAENTNGLALVSNVLSAQSADATHPGMVNNTTQTFSGQKTFSTGLTGTLTGSASLNVLTSALGNLTDAGTDGITVTGGTGSVVGSVSLSQQVSDTTHNGYLSSTDWNTFNGKQAAGNYLTALTGDVTASGPGSAASTVAKIQGTAVSGTTGSTNVVFSSAPTLSNPVVGTQSQGDTSTRAASTAYVDVAVSNAVSGINPAVAVQAATTSASDTSSFTYNNGASGVGATLTGPNNTALTVDGYTFTAVGQRILVKNDTQSPSGAFNGIYSVTTLQAALQGVVLTRALDYNQPSDMNNTGAIPVINGTTNGTTSWVLTSLVTTVGTDPLAFTRFTRNPADFLLVANNLSDVGTKATAFNNVSPVTSTGDLIIGNGSNSNTRLVKGTQYQTLQTGASTLGYDAVHLDQAAAVTGVLPNANTTANATPTASAIAAFDANKNLSANSLLEGYTTTATAATTTTLVVGDTEQQYFTGSTTQTVKLPVVSTLVLGQKFRIVNNSSGVVTVQSSGANTIQAMAAATNLIVTVVSTSGTGTSSWDALYNLGATGTVTSVAASGPSGIATWSSAVTTSGTLTQTLSNQNAGTYLGGPYSGSATTPTFKAFQAPTQQVFTSGSSATYTTATGALWIKIKMVGAGGGGAGVGLTTAPTGSVGGTTTFNSINAIGGSGGIGSISVNGQLGGVGGTGGTGTANIRIPGQSGQAGPSNIAGSGSTAGGAGGSSMLGFGGQSTLQTVTGNAGQNYGGGGSAAGATAGSTSTVGGGGGGEYAEIIIASPTTSYTYTVGAGGAGGIGTGTNAQTGGAGKAGIIIVDEYYQ